MPSILLLHGALGSKQHFDQLIIELEKSINVYTLNFEGHGGDNSDRPFSMSNFSENVLDFIEENKLQGINVFGYSMGGYVALRLAAKYPDLFSEIITLGTKFDWSVESAAKEVRMLNPEIIEEKVPRFADRLKELHAPNDWKEVMRKTAKMMLDLGNGEAMSEKDFKSIKGKIIVARGSNDNMVSQTESLAIVQQIPNAQYVELLNVEHPIEKIETKVISGLISTL